MTLGITTCIQCRELKHQLAVGVRHVEQGLGEISSFCGEQADRWAILVAISHKPFNRSGSRCCSKLNIQMRSLWPACVFERDIRTLPPVCYILFLEARMDPWAANRCWLATGNEEARVGQASVLWSSEKTEKTGQR